MSYAAANADTSTSPCSQYSLIGPPARRSRGCSRDSPFVGPVLAEPVPRWVRVGASLIPRWDHHTRTSARSTKTVSERKASGNGAIALPSSQLKSRRLDRRTEAWGFCLHSRVSHNAHDEQRLCGPDAPAVKHPTHNPDSQTLTPSCTSGELCGQRGPRRRP